jgi:hypothetical protein
VEVDEKRKKKKQSYMKRGPGHNWSSDEGGRGRGSDRRGLSTEEGGEGF